MSDDRYAIERACERLVLDSARYNDRAEWAALSGLYTIDAMLTRPSGQVVGGRDAIEVSYDSGAADRRTLHLCSNVRVTVDGPAAASASTLVQLFVWTEPAQPTDALPSIGTPLLGEFDDTFRYTEEGWRIASRVARLFGRSG
jgi:hypothetical protein